MKKFFVCGIFALMIASNALAEHGRAGANYSGTWSGSARLIKNTCPGSYLSTISFSHRVRNVGSFISIVDASGNYLQGGLRGAGFYALKILPVPGYPNCAEAVGYAYPSVRGTSATARIGLSIACDNSLVCEIIYEGNARRR